MPTELNSTGLTPRQINTADELLVINEGGVNPDTIARIQGGLGLFETAQSGTSYTLAIADAGRVVGFTNSSAKTVTIPTNASVAFATGSNIVIRNDGAGVLTLTAAGGVDLNGVTAGSITLATGEEAFLWKTGTNAWSARASAPFERYVFCSADYTLTSTTSSQRLFNETANGAVTLEPGIYLYEGIVYLSTMSGTSGNGLINLRGAGTATVASWLWAFHGVDSATPLSPGTQNGSLVASSSTSSPNAITAGTGTSMFLNLKGAMRVTAGGTLIPSIALTTAASALVKVGSHISFRRIGASGQYTAGNWT